MCTLAQRFGRAARDPHIQGIGLLLVEPSIDDEEDDDVARPPRKRRRGRQEGRSKRARLAPSLEGSQSQPQVGPGPQETSSQQESSQAESQDGVSQEGNNLEEEEDDIDVSGEATNQETVEDHVPNLHSRWNEYNEWWNEQRTDRGREPALRDLLHGVTPDINCRRVPWKLFFSDGSPTELGKLSNLFVYLMMPRRSHVTFYSVYSRQ